MPSYSLTPDEQKILTTWLYEPNGYLDYFSLSASSTIRAQLKADPDLDVPAWIDANAGGGWRLLGERHDAGGDECAMVWWTLANDGKDISLAELPAEAERWAGTLRDWEISIDRAFQDVSKEDFNRQSKDLYDASEQKDGNMGTGDHLDRQKRMGTAVAVVLEQ